MVTPKAKKDDLADFIKNDIVPLKNFNSPLNAFGEYLYRELSGRDILYIPEKFQKIILGGVQENGSFSTNSLAEFYSQYFGIGLPQIDRVRYINSVKNGVRPESIVIKSDPAEKKIDSNGQNNFSMFHYISAIDTLCTKIINKSIAKSIIPQIPENSDLSSFEEKDNDALIDNLSQILFMIRDFYNASLKILPTYNEYSMFLDSIRGIPKDYLMEAYPSIANEFSNLMDNLDLEIKRIVDLPITNKYIEYVFPKQDGIASDIFNLYGNIFDLSYFLFSQPDNLFDGVMDEYSNFLKNAIKSVDGILDSNASKLIKSTQREIYISIDEKGFTSEYSVFPNQHISAFSKSISPLLFSGCAHLEITHTRYASITIYNHIAGVLQ